MIHFRIFLFVLREMRLPPLFLAAVRQLLFPDIAVEFYQLQKI